MPRQRRNRTLTGLVLAITALALGLVAQHYFGGIRPAKTPTDGLIIYAGAAALFVVALARTPPPSGLPIATPGGGTSDPRRRTRATIMLLVAGGALAASLHLFRSGTGSLLSWALYLAAIASFLLAAYAFRSLAPSGASHRDKGRPSRWQVLALAAILVVAVAFRLWRFTELPYGMWYDEADNGLAVRHILRDPNYWPVYVPSTNLPAHFLYLIALSFRILGDSMYAIRAVAVVFGLLTVVAAYYCGRELFPERAAAYGLILAALMAVSRWDVNWSRIGMHGVTLPFFELWVVAALLRALRTGRCTSFAWAGVALGLGLCFYSPFRIFPLVVGGFGLVWFWHWVRRAPPLGRGGAWYALQTWALPLSLLILGALVAFAPVAQYSLRRPELFWDRARRISILRAPEVQERPVATVLDSTAKHLLMFNYRGDPNGRHNLPGAPMLDRLSGVLLVLGVLVSAAHPALPRSVLLLSWLLLPLTGGILSTYFEAPQSLRSFGALPAAYALACVALAWFAGEWRRVFGAVRRPLAAIAVLLLLAIGLENGLIYFHYWANDFASWAAFNPAETRMAQDIRRYREHYDLRFDPLLTAHLTTRYLVPEYDSYQHFDPATVFPIRHTNRRGVMLFIAPDTQAVRDHAVMLYPGVGTETFEHRTGYPVMYRYTFSRGQIEAVQGLDARYTLLGDAGDGEVARIDASLDLDAHAGAPVDGPFRATWTGGLLAERYGTYVLQLEAPGPCLLSLDGQPVLEGVGPHYRQVVLAEGVHSLYVNCEVREPGTIRLSWHAPGQDRLQTVPSSALYRASWPIGGMLGFFYPQANETAAPALARVDRQISYYFHFLPMDRPYSARWVGRLYAPLSGRYRFALRAVSSAWLAIDGQAVIEPTGLGEFDERELVLEAGMHDLELGFLDRDSHSQIYLYWQPPEGPLVRIPPDVLFLPSAGAWWPAD
jgi:4-amino-4-deoxy-L-arabinose transferase-like glycosyltransferase